MFVDWTPNMEHEHVSQTGSIEYGDLNILNPESLQKCLLGLNNRTLGMSFTQQHHYHHNNNNQDDKNRHTNTNLRWLHHQNHPIFQNFPLLVETNQRQTCYQILCLQL